MIWSLTVRSACQWGPRFPNRDAIESCSGLEGAEATACFAYFGCDRQKVKQWFSTVVTLEQALSIQGARMRRHAQKALQINRLVHCGRVETCMSDMPRPSNESVCKR